MEAFDIADHQEKPQRNHSRRTSQLHVIHEETFKWSTINGAYLSSGNDIAI